MWPDVGVVPPCRPKSVAYTNIMSYQTVEVELENGHVRPSKGEALPEKAHALLTILGPAVINTTEAEGPSIADLAGDLVGIGNGTHTDLSYNKAHLSDLGR